jgi:hypothetical protein
MPVVARNELACTLEILLYRAPAMERAAARATNATRADVRPQDIERPGGEAWLRWEVCTDRESLIWDVPGGSIRVAVQHEGARQLASIVSRQRPVAS